VNNDVVISSTDRSGGRVVPSRLVLLGHRQFVRDLHPVRAATAVAVAGFVLLCVLAVGLGVFVTHVLADGAVGHGDTDIARWLAERRTPVLDDLSLVGSYLAETVTVLLVLAVTIATLAVRREWALLALVATSLALEGAQYLVVTTIVSRTRPPGPRLENLIVSDSFPSGHTAAAVALYGCLAIVVCADTRRRLWRTLALTAAVLVPIAVATSRVYRGMHYPTDVISGALIGAACIAVAYLAVRSAIAVTERPT
jgi:undecaprenyl-diphosphatase